MPDEKRLYQLVNSYPVKLAEKTKVTLSWIITDNLYDSAFSILYKVVDTHGQIYQFGTVYSEEVELRKGDYKVLLQIEHSDYKVLDAAKGFAMALDAQLSESSKTLKLNLYRGTMI